MRTNYLITLLLLLFVINEGYSQLSIDPNTTFAKCPNEWIIYIVTNSVNASCSYDWTVTNGQIQGGTLVNNVSTFSGGNIVTVKWFDITMCGKDI